LKSENTNFIDYLVSLSKEGRKRSFIDLCEISLQNIYTIVYRLLLDAKLARKITIQTFLKAWDRIKEYDTQESFVEWLKNFAIKLALDELKQSNLSKIRVEKKISVQNDLELLDNLIISLPSEERVIFVLHDLEGYSYEEINLFFGEMILDEIRTKVINTREYLMSKLSL
jgi:RNA polymerase sigma-70 factor, ECF subfamily